MLFKLLNLNSNLALTLGYLNPALNNSAQNNFVCSRSPEDRDGVGDNIVLLNSKQADTSTIKA